MSLPVIVRMLTSGAKESGFVPVPFEPLPQLRPVFRPSRLDASERPVLVESEAKIVADNGLFRRIETSITFTNPNSRVFEGELEFPIPEGASVCGNRLYRLGHGAGEARDPVVPSGQAEGQAADRRGEDMRGVTGNPRPAAQFATASWAAFVTGNWCNASPVTVEIWYNAPDETT